MTTSRLITALRAALATSARITSNGVARQLLESDVRALLTELEQEDLEPGLRASVAANEGRTR